MSEAAQIGVVVVTYRRPDCLGETLEALHGMAPEFDSLLVVDNDGDGSVEALVRQHALPIQRVDYLAAPVNGGPAGAMALALDWAVAHSVDWLVRIDDDKPPVAGSVAALVEHVATHDRPSLAGVGFVGARFDWRTGDVRRVPTPELRGPVLVDVLGTNHGPMFRVSSMAAVGGFEPSLVFGFTEPEFCMRLRLAGFELEILGDEARERRLARQRPEGRARAHGEADWRRYYTLRNQVWALGRHISRRAALRRAVLGLLRPFRQVRHPRALASELCLAVVAVRHGWSGRLGIYEPVAPVELPPT